jgi:hypothetical protein
LTTKINFGNQHDQSLTWEQNIFALFKNRPDLQVLEKMLLKLRFLFKLFDVGRIHVSYSTTKEFACRLKY